MPRCVLKTVFALFVSTVLSSHAIDFTWDGAGDGISWNDPANWTANSGFPGASDTAIFNGPGTVELDTAIPNGFVETQINGGRVNLNSLANAIPSGTLVVANGATLGILTSAGLSGLGSADLTLNGGTLEFLAGGAADVDGLDETIFDLPTGDPRNDIEGYRNRATNLTAADAQGILSGHLHYNADADITIRANDLGASGFNDGDFAALWTTRFTPNEDGAWGLRFSASDDNVGLWIDVDQNGTFELTDRIYERTCCAGSGDQFTPALINGQTYLLGIVLSDTGGGGYLRDMEYKAPSGAWTDLNPSTSPGLFQVTAVAAGTLANNLSVNADSTVRMGTALPGLTLGDLTFGGSADLLVDSVDGRQGLSFSGNTLLNGSVSFTQTGKARVRVGSISELTTSGISQQGDGNLIFTTSNSYSGFTEVNAGTLELRADGGLGLDTDITIVNAGGSLVANGNFNYTVAEIIELHGAGNSDSAGAFVNIGNKDWFVPMILESDARIYNLSGNLSLFGQVDLAGNDLELFCDVNQIEIETSGGLNGAGNITAGGINGRIILYNNVNDINNFTGTLTISNIIWDARSPDALGTTDGPTIVTDGGRLELRDGRTWGDDIFISGTDFGAGAIRQENNFNTVTGTITLDADAMIYANSGTLTVAGQIVGPHTLQLAGNIGVTILTQENLMDAAEIVSGTTRIQHVGSLGGTTNLVLNSRTALELDGGLTLDQSGALQGVEFNGGRLGSFNGLNTLDFPLSLKTFGGLELGGEGDLMVTQPFGLGNDPLFDIEVDGLSHYGFHHFGDALLDLDGNGGLMKQGRPEDLQGLFGLTLLTTGPQGRGLDFNVDQDFLDAGVIGQGDSYDNLWLGYLNVPAGLAGNWEFRNAGDDDRGGIWIDLNTNGVFESSTPGFGSNRGEQLSWEDGGAKVVTLAEGSYLIAFTHHEFSGEAAVDFRFRTSFMLANGHPELIIKPSDSNQAGLWSPYAPVFPKNTLTKSGNGAVFLPVANTYNNGTKIEGGALVAFDAESLGLPGTPLTLAGGTLALSGDIAIDVGDVTIEGAGGRYWNGVLSNVDGSNTFTATSLAIGEFFTGDTGMGSTDGQLT
ncbi:MAG: autotransporter-associated beta strand protein, partial [Candidatus Omnitrophota bacterium]